MSLLTIIQRVCDRTGISRPDTVVDSTDEAVRQLFALANEEGEELAKRYPWQALTSGWTFVTNAAETQTNTPIPEDLDRFIPNTFFNRTTQRRLIGPISPQEFEAVQANPASASVYLAFRERAGAFLITPTPSAGETIAYEYVSRNWARSSVGVGKAEFTVDGDGAYLDEGLIALGVRWRWKQAKGLDYSEDMETYERAVARAMAHDGGAGALSIRAGRTAPMQTNFPDGNFGI